MTMPTLFTHRDLARFKRHHWQPHTEGCASLSWNFDEGRWELRAPWCDVWLPGEVDLETVNQTWDRFVAVANGQA